MVTQHLRLIDEGLAMNCCAIAFVVNCPLGVGFLGYKLRVQGPDGWTEYNSSASFNRAGYNVVLNKIPVAKSMYAELEVIDMEGIDVIYSSSLSANAMVAL